MRSFVINTLLLELNCENWMIISFLFITIRNNPDQMFSLQILSQMPLLVIFL